MNLVRPGHWTLDIFCSSPRSLTLFTSFRVSTCTYHFQPCRRLAIYLRTPSAPARTRTDRYPPTFPSRARQSCNRTDDTRRNRNLRYCARKQTSHCVPRHEAPRQTRCPLEAPFLRHSCLFRHLLFDILRHTGLIRTTTTNMVSFRSLALLVAAGYASAQAISSLDPCAVSQLLYGVSFPLFRGLRDVFRASSGAGGFIGGYQRHSGAG